jgi:hypothetical protein
VGAGASAGVGLQDDLHTQIQALLAQKQRLEEAVDDAASATAVRAPLPLASPLPVHAATAPTSATATAYDTAVSGAAEYGRVYPFSPLSYHVPTSSQSQSQFHLLSQLQSSSPSQSPSQAQLLALLQLPSPSQSPTAVDPTHVAHLEHALRIARTAVTQSATDMDRAHHEISLLATHMDHLRRENLSLKRSSPPQSSSQYS